jgi:aminoglycoside 3-N-acetyltransferase
MLLRHTLYVKSSSATPRRPETKMPRPMPRGPLCTIASLTSDFRRLGIQPGDTVLVHSSLSSMGWVNGGAEAVVRALLSVLDCPARGTLVVPTASSDNSDPCIWQDPPVPEEWWQEIRDSMPAYDPVTTRTRSMGVIPETVRLWPGAARSAHPQSSFAAVGPNAEVITAGHSLSCLLGPDSPLGVLERISAKVLLLGVGFDRCTSFHLAEYRLPSPPRMRNGFAIRTEDGGKRKWMTLEDVDISGGDFEEIGLAFMEEEGGEAVRTTGKVGRAQCFLFAVDEAVAFAERWMRKHRNAS